MKTAMKRLLSLVLVAMMLVSIMPFQARADETAGGEGGTGGGEGEPAAQATEFELTVKVYYFVDGDANSMTTGPVVKKNVETGTKSATDVFALIDDDIDTNNLAYYAFYEPNTNNQLDTMVISADREVQLNVVKAKTQFNVTATVVFSENVEGSKTWNNISEITSAMLVDAAEEAQKNTPDAPKAPQYTLGTPELLINGTKATLPYAAKDIQANANVVVKVPVIEEFTVTLMESSTKEFMKLYTVQHKLGTPSAEPKPDDKTFEGWDTAENGFNGEKLSDLYGKTLEKNWTFYAKYKPTTGSNPDGKSDLKVVAKFYTEGREKDEVVIYTIHDLPENTKVYDILKSHQKDINKAINDEGNGVWIDEKFYENSVGSEEIDSYDVMDGNRTVYVMVGNKNAVKVQLYVHTTYKTEPTYIVNMFGYEYNDTLKRADIREVLEDKWPNRTYSFDGMYNDDAWIDVVGGKQNVTALKSFPIYDNYDGDGVVNVHIYATLVSNKADTSNPKTGDTVLMAVTVLGISASALAALYFLNKKKQSV